jgi:hypothetical protein
MAKVDLSSIDRNISVDIQKLLQEAFSDGIDCNIPIGEGKSITFDKGDGTVVTLGLNASGGLSIDNAGTLADIKVASIIVDCSGGGTAETEDIVVLPAGSTILEVIVHTTEAFDGDATTTFEVGIAGNIDNYVDTVDFDVSTLNTFVSMTGGTTNDNKVPEVVAAETTIIATWTNTANMTAGKVKVTVVYI